jgi:hypothetical protein
MITALYNLLTNWKQDPCNAMHGNANNGVSFANVNTNLEEIDKSCPAIADPAIVFTTEGTGQRKR